MINWIEKSASTMKAEGKGNNLLTGKPFNRGEAMKAVKQAIYLASSGEDPEMRNIEWLLTFGKRVGQTPDNYVDPNKARRQRIADKKARLKMLKILCTKKAKSICGDRDRCYFETKNHKYLRRRGSDGDFIMTCPNIDKSGYESPPPEPKTYIKFAADFKPIVLDNLRKTKSMPTLYLDRGCPFGKGFDYLFEGMEERSRQVCLETGSEDSFDKDFTIYKELRNIELR